MRAITLESDGLHYQASHAEPTPAEGEVLVQVLQAGICETDLQLAQGYMGFRGILGHEFVGIAQAGTHAGRRVVGEINCNCRVCPTCQAGRPTHCPHRTVIGIDRHDGAFAQSVAIPEHNLHVVPEGVTDDQALFTEPLAAAFEILQQVAIESTDRIAILGDGRLGYLSAQVLSSVTDRITVFGKHGVKLLRFGHRGYEVVQIPSTDPVELPHHKFDVVVDCTGSTTGLPMAIHLVRPRGTVVLKTTVADRHELSLASIVIDEISVVGSRCGPFATALDALAGGQVDVDGLITDRYSLDQVNPAFASAVNPNSFKVVFEIGSASD
ncbi:2-deoxy-scyllo-inosamine dehydrogenase [Stieleria neptunia]|uniref:2-deoxy-scyllo-inosamine dehydrogenase n=1 Tax=Stieleria neptunia TaxID=2527979 RepID=A0A518I253_9BACT|nr:alcohol dehydrogenase catalytic domain-containing protein [Stieleria neptunia]QDV47193.1 2-deoxy-scyllo-inosamine dehydrogenase [Stieleria neptunia]